MKIITNDDRFKSNMVMNNEGEIIANVILEHYTSHIVVLHFCVFYKNDIDWHDFIHNKFFTQLPQSIKHVIIPFKTNSPRLRLFKSWGFEFTYNKQFDLYVFRHDL